MVGEPRTDMTTPAKISVAQIACVINDPARNVRKVVECIRQT
jgi:predicted amidohydrolase